MAKTTAQPKTTLISQTSSAGELAGNSACSFLKHTAADGKTCSAKYCNLDAIIAVGCRVNSYQATQFRNWATKTLREFIINGFVMDDERLRVLCHVSALVPLRTVSSQDAE